MNAIAHVSVLNHYHIKGWRLFWDTEEKKKCYSELITDKIYFTYISMLFFLEYDSCKYLWW